MSDVLIVEDDLNLREALGETLALAGFVCELSDSGEAALANLQRVAPKLIITDMQMGGMSGQTLLKSIKHRQANLPVLIMTAYGTVNDAVEAMRAGATDYLLKPFEPQELVNKVRHYLPQQSAPVSQQVVSADPHSVALLALADKVARTDATVLISGESGTGKEVLARYIHDQSARQAQPFVAINCAAIPENMLEACLFGYEKGAFTGAVQTTPGKFEQAQHGTLLLDEISEMDIGLQAKLLRVLQEREVERLGSRKMLSLDVRVIATTNRDLAAAVKQNKFREDLFYRLNVFPLQWLPLRDRSLDILPLANYLLQKHSPTKTVRFSELALDRLQTHAWPGNIREMDNVIQRALILQSGDEISAEDLQLSGGHSLATPRTALISTIINDYEDGAASSEDLKSEDLKNHEQQLILRALKTYPNRKDAADSLGISQRTLRYKVAKLREQGIEI